MTPAADSTSVECPRCCAKLAVLRGKTGLCPGCGSGILVEGGRTFDISAYPVLIEAASVPRILAEALRRRSAPRHTRLVEIHRVDLPYWIEPPAGLRAAFSTAIEAARRLEPPEEEALPAPLAEPPPVSADQVVPAPLRLVLLPAFDVRYEAGGRSFHVLIDACRGRVLGDLFPQRDAVHLHLAMAAVLALDVAAFALASFAAPDNLVRSIAVALLAPPVYFFTAAAVRLRDR